MTSVADSTLRTYLPPTSLRIGAILAAILCCTLAYIWHDIGYTRLSRLFTLDAIAVFSVLGAIDALTTRVTLTDSSLLIRRNFRQRTYSRDTISKASWEGGAPVSILVEPVGWVNLPNVSSPQSLVRVIDRWIERTPVA